MSSGVYLRTESYNQNRQLEAKRTRELDGYETKLNSETNIKADRGLESQSMGRVDSRSSHRHVFIRCALFTGRPELAHAYDDW